jgi:hypothetical protein
LAANLQLLCNAMTTSWPSLPLDAWRPTLETLHRYAQIVGKIQLALTPTVNHYWNVALRVTPRGLATSTLYAEDRTLDIELDMVDHLLVVRTSDRKRAVRELRPLAVADFDRELLTLLDSLGIHVTIWDHPVEIRTDAIPFSQDRQHAAYDREYVERFFRVLTNASEVLGSFRARFQGKCSGVGFYWGTFDLSVARYSGRRAPDPPTGSRIERESYSHAVSEVGFWPGDSLFPAPGFFALHYPEPHGYARAAVHPAAASWWEASHCFVLPYETIRDHDPRAQILAFCQSTYEAGANLAGWSGSELEREMRPE